jgi:Undecaprenyl-phosphate glucose phosphotransferase
MRRTRVSDEIFGGAVAVVDALVVFASGAAVYGVYVGLISQESPPDPRRYAAAALLVTALLAQRLAVMRVYEVEALYDIRQGIRGVLIGWTTAIVALVILAFLLKVSDEYSRIWLVGWYVLTATALAGSRVLIARLLRQWARRGHFFRRVAVVGAGQLGMRFVGSTLHDPSLCVVAAFDDRTTRTPATLHGVPVLGTTADLYEFLRQSYADIVLIALPLSADRRIADLVAKLNGLAVDVLLLSDAIGFKLTRRPISYPAGIPAISIADRPISGWHRIAKRGLDTCLAAAALIVLSPLLAAVAILLKLESPGPVLFRQARLGFNNNVFEIYKFRTMWVEATDANAERLVTRSDSRVTPLGRVLRRWSLDELPQLWNVLMGDMSLVGPRPHPLRAKAGDKLYQEVVAEYAARHRVKPGITGWAQVNGWRGGTDTIEKIQRRVEHDLYYIDHWSIAFDVWILLLTVAKLGAQKNAF